MLAAGHGAVGDVPGKIVTTISRRRATVAIAGELVEYDYQCE